MIFMATPKTMLGPLFASASSQVGRGRPGGWAAAQMRGRGV